MRTFGSTAEQSYLMNYVERPIPDGKVGTPMINAQAYNTNLGAINKRLGCRTDNMAGPRKYEMAAARSKFVQISPGRSLIPN